MKRWQLYCGIALIVTSCPSKVVAQRQVKQTVERYGVERYFDRALDSGKLRRLSGNRIDTVSASTAVRPGDYLVTRIGTVVREPPNRSTGEERITLPDRAFVEVGGGNAMLLMPVVIVEQGGLNYVPNDQSFQGSFLIGLEDSLRRKTTVALTNPINFLVTGAADEITPTDVKVDHTNLPFSAVRLTAAAPPDSVAVTIRSTLHPDGVEVPIPVRRRPLPLSASPIKIQGFGLESATIAIGPAANASGTVVRVSSDNGNVADSEVRLSPAGTAETKIRSSGIGEAVVRVRSTAFREAKARVSFVFPTLFLVFSIVGGVVGGTARWLQRLLASNADVRIWPIVVVFLANGVLVGTIVSAAYAVGINLLGVEPAVSTGQAVVFVFAGLGGYLGGSVLKVATP